MKKKLLHKHHFLKVYQAQLQFRFFNKLYSSFLFKYTTSLKAMPRAKFAVGLNFSGSGA
jgi:menaquinone-dependent protoporphyrinogen IX oxidase